ncbi:MAG: CBS domain-containing protein [Candidatus Aquicultorales bacterium]
MKSMTIKDAMTQTVIWIRENDTAENAAKKMLDCDIGSLPVLNADGSLAGILTDRDIVVRACAKGMAAADTNVSQIMTKNPATCTPSETIQDVAERMAEMRIRRLPVVENNQLVGFCAVADLAMALRNQPQVVEQMLWRISSPAKPRCEAA